MALSLKPVKGTERVFRASLDQLDGGLSTRTFPHLLPTNRLSRAINAVYYQDGVVGKRPGNSNYGGGSGATGSGHGIDSLARFYKGTPQTGTLVAQSNGGLYKGTDIGGAFALIGSGFAGSGKRASFAQTYDPDFSPAAASILIICDGTRVPYGWDGLNLTAFSTAHLALGRGGSAITPSLVCEWGPHIVYSGQPDEPTAVYIADALRPERFTGFGFEDSVGTAYTPYFPGTRDGSHGVVTQIAVWGPYLVVFFNSAIVIGENTGSYGAMNFVWSFLSRSKGCPSGYSVVAMDEGLYFFGGDRFYVTDTQGIYPLPDELPTLYSKDSVAFQKPLIANINTVFGVRHGSEYWASYDIGGGILQQVAVFNAAANGGFIPGIQIEDDPEGVARGGAWSIFSGMQLNSAVECRGPGDAYQLFWGSNTDLVAQYDPGGVYGDFGQPTYFECATKALFLGEPEGIKTIQGLYVQLVLNANIGSFVSQSTPYVVMDQLEVQCTPVEAAANVAGALYGGGGLYGSIMYNSPQNTVQETPKATPTLVAQGLSFQMGVFENSTNPFNIIGFTAEVTIDEPVP